jgi:hypothetical protein
MDSQPAEFTNSIGIKRKLIPAGEFLMGSKQMFDLGFRVACSAVSKRSVADDLGYREKRCDLSLGF